MSVRRSDNKGKSRPNRRQRRLAQRIRSFFRAVFRTALVLLAAVSAGGASFTLPGYVEMFRRWTLNLEAFHIGGMKYSGERYIPAGSMEPVLSRFYGTSLFNLDIDGVKSELRAAGLFERFDVTKAWPDKIGIEVEERLPLGLVRRKDTLCCMDRSCEILPVVEGAPLPDRPLVTASGNDGESRAVELLSFLDIREKDIMGRLSEVIVAADGNIQMVLRRPQCLVKLGGEWDERRFARLRFTLAEAGRREFDPVEIDLSIASTAIVRMGENGKQE